MSTAASPRVADEWLRRVTAEYSSSAVTAELVLWLLQLGAAPELVREGLRIVDDELAHAELSAAVVAETGDARTPSLVQEHLGLQRDPQRPLLADVALHGVEVFCLGETVAVPLFVAMREGCSVPVARAALDRIVRDEVRHRDFGWALLDWLLQVHGEVARRLVTEALPGMVARVRDNYGQADYALRQAEPAHEDAAWGLIPTDRYARILARCEQRDFAPRFAELGIDTGVLFETVAGPASP